MSAGGFGRVVTENRYVREPRTRKQIYTWERLRDRKALVRRWLDTRTHVSFDRCSKYIPIVQRLLKDLGGYRDIAVSLLISSAFADGYDKGLRNETGNF